MKNKNTIKWTLKLDGKKYSAEIYVGDVLNKKPEDQIMMIAERTAYNIRLSIEYILKNE